MGAVSLGDCILLVIIGVKLIVKTFISEDQDLADFAALDSRLEHWVVGHAAAGVVLLKLREDIPTEAASSSQTWSRGNEEL